MKIDLFENVLKTNQNKTLEKLKNKYIETGKIKQKKMSKTKNINKLTLNLNY